MKRRRIFLLNDQTSPRINSELACEIGLNESIILLQFEFWQSISQHIHEDKVWFYKTIPEIRETFRFWSIETVKRTIAEIIRKKYIHKANFNKSKFDKTAWYSLNFEELGKLNSVRISDQVNLTSSNENAIISDQVNLTRSRVSICPDPECQFDPTQSVNLTLSPIREYTENTDRQTDIDMPLSGFPDTAEKSVSRSVGQSVSLESIFSMCKRQSKGIQDLVESAVKKHGKKYVMNQVEYCNAECRNLRAYRKLLADAIEGDYGSAWKDDQIFGSTLDSQQKEALEKKKRSEVEAQKAESERQKQKELRISSVIESLPAETMDKLKSEFTEVMPDIIRRSFKKQGWNSLSVKVHFEKFIADHMEVAA